jgi:hypothetical protein
MKKISTVAAKASRKISQPKLTVGLNLGDRSSWYCVLDESGNVLLEQRLGTTPKALREGFGGMRRSRIALEKGNAFAMGKPVVERVGTRGDKLQRCNSIQFPQVQGLECCPL